MSNHVRNNRLKIVRYPSYFGNKTRYLFASPTKPSKFLQSPSNSIIILSTLLSTLITTSLSTTLPQNPTRSFSTKIIASSFFIVTNRSNKTLKVKNTLTTSISASALSWITAQSLKKNAG